MEGRSFVLSQKEHDKIKHLNYHKMDLYIKSIYLSGYEDGLSDSDGLTIDDVKEVLLKVKGIGEKRVEDILNALKQKLEGDFEWRKYKEMCHWQSKW